MPGRQAQDRPAACWPRGGPSRGGHRTPRGIPRQLLAVSTAPESQPGASRVTALPPPGAWPGARGGPVDWWGEAPWLEVSAPSPLWVSPAASPFHWARSAGGPHPGWLLSDHAEVMATPPGDPHPCPGLVCRSPLPTQDQNVSYLKDLLSNSFLLPIITSLRNAASEHSFLQENYKQYFYSSIFLKLYTGEITKHIEVSIF